MAGAGQLQPLAQMERGCSAGLELKIIEGGKKTKEKGKAKREK